MTRSKLCGALVILAGLLGSTSHAQIIEPGFDLFETDTQSGLTDFAGIPFEGVPLGTFDFGGTLGVQGLPTTDTIVRRLAPASALPGQPATVPIELVALQLRSVDPVDLTNFGQPGQQDFLYVTLTDGLPSPGQMQIDFASQNGGTYQSTIGVNVDLRVGSLGGPILQSIPTLNLHLEPQPWSRKAPPQARKIKGINHRLAPDMSKTRDFWPGTHLNGWPSGCQPHGETGTFPASHCINTARQVPKWSQLPRNQVGENIGSSVDWRQVMNPPTSTEPVAKNWVVADDFRSNGEPILGVKWWGSYFKEEHQPTPVANTDGSFTFVPVIEDGFVISFHSDIPANQNPDGFSKPDQLLATYTTWEVHVKPTNMIGWDGHRIWEYSVDLEDTHPEHLDPNIAEPGQFNEHEGVVYWISIVAQNGHDMDEDWNTTANNDPVEEEHFWGWHTSPDSFNDLPVMGNLKMPSPDEWLYGEWNPVDTQHDARDMAFELYTAVPEPSTLALLLLGIVIGFGSRSKRRP